MTTIKEITKKIFSVSYENELEDDTVSETYEIMAADLIANNKWSDVYASWFDYLVNDCKTEEEILNFANLFWLYNGYKQFIPNAVEFSAFFYANISFEHHPEAISVIDGIAWFALVNSGVICESKMSFDNYAPNDIPAIDESIKKWKEKGYGLR